MNRKFTPAELKTIQFYDNKASEWASSHSGGQFWKSEMKKFHKLLPAGKVLEIGSGGGRDAKELIALGYEYTGTDISNGLIKEAIKHNPNATFLKQSVYELNFPKDTFDGFWTSAVLLHIPKSRIDKALTKIHKVVKPEGIGFISIKQGVGEKADENERFFAYYSEEEFKKKLKDNNFEIIDSSIRPMSEKTIWLIYLVKVKK